VPKEINLKDDQGKIVLPKWNGELTSKEIQRTIRTFITIHYRVYILLYFSWIYSFIILILLEKAGGKRRVPWKKLEDAHADFIDSKYLPSGVGQKDLKLNDPMQWKTLQLATFWTFWYDRQKAGKQALCFKRAEGKGKGKMVVENESEEDGEDDDLVSPEAADKSNVVDSEADLGLTGRETPRKRKRADADIEEMEENESGEESLQTKKQRASDGKPTGSARKKDTGGEEDGSPAAFLKDASSSEEIATRKGAFLTGLCPEDRYQNLVAALASAPVSFRYIVYP
jgi:hypothetical protein